MCSTTWVLWGGARVREMLSVVARAQMLARMKQDAGVAAPSQREASPFEEVPPLGTPSSTRRPDSAADDATPRSGGGAAASRKATQLVRSSLAPSAGVGSGCRGEEPAHAADLHDSQRNL